MGPLDSFPTIPGDTSALTPEQQASVMVQSWGEAAEAYATCSVNRDILIEWIGQ